MKKEYPLKKFEDLVKNYKHICWYPSAGSDLRELLFLSDWYYERFAVPRAKGQELPDLFILSSMRTDCHNDLILRYSSRDYGFFSPVPDYDHCELGRLENPYWFKNKPVKLFDDGKTKITVLDIKLLDISLGGEGEDLYKRVCLSEIPSYYGRCFHMKLSVSSKKFGVTNKWNTELIYIFAENTALLRNVFLPNKIQCEYVVEVRYGEAFGGSSLKGNWIKNFFDRLGTRYFIANRKYAGSFSNAYFSPDAECLSEYFGSDFDRDNEPELEEIYSVEGFKWSDYGEVVWHKVKPGKV